MKKTTITLMLLLSAIINAQDKVCPIITIESGYSEKTLKLYYYQNSEETPKIDESSLYADLEIGAAYKGIKITTNTTTYFVPHIFTNSRQKNGTPWQNAPYMSVYKIGLSYNIKNVEIGATHMCGHLVQSSQNEKNKRLKMGDNKIYIKIDLLNKK